MYNPPAGFACKYSDNKTFASENKRVVPVFVSCSPTSNDNLSDDEHVDKQDRNYKQIKLSTFSQCVLKEKLYHVAQNVLELYSMTVQ